MLRGIWLSVLLLLAASSAANAQGGGRITGRVTSTEGGRSLQGVRVVVEGANRAAITDSAGRYAIADVAAGVHRVTARRLGLASASQQVTVAAGQAATADFALASSAVQLEGLVTVGYGTQSRRNVSGAISTIKPEDIRQVVSANPLDATSAVLKPILADVKQPSEQPVATVSV